MNSPLSLLPAPRHLQIHEGHFVLSRATALSDSSHVACNAADWLIESVFEQSGVRLARAQAGAIRFIEREGKPESYELEIAPDSITIRAGDASGFFYGVITLLQCVPFEAPSHAGEWAVPCLQIEDAPRFAWRGMMLDSVRHFQPVSWVKKFINALALHKINVLHWHLTDDQGWRIEIEKYPALTSVSAWRAQSRIGHENEGGLNDFDGQPHGGFYSRSELREVVEYASKRGINIVPEIEMPGHATSVIAAYPALSCTGGPFEVAQNWGIFDDVFCAGNDEVFRFFETVLEEVLEIFPSQFIHIGGDECHKTRWQACLKCQSRIRVEGLADEAALQSWFVRHFDVFLNERGRRLIGWDEILEGGLATHAAVMSWRGEEGGIAAARAGHDVVMTPHEQTYFDYYQSADRAAEPLSIGGCLPLENVFQFTVIPAALSPAQAKHVLGGQGQLWTEYMPRPDSVEYMAFPRVCALAEALWRSEENGATSDFEEFGARLQPHLKRLARGGIGFRPVTDCGADASL